MRSIHPLVLLAALTLINVAAAEAQTCAPQPPGLIAWWRGESNTTDFTGAHDGALHGEPTFGPGKVGQAFVFDGFDDAIYVPYAAELAPTTITVSAWIKPDLVRPYAMAAVKMNGTNDYSGFALELSADGTEVFFWVNVLGEGWVDGPGWLHAPPMPITPGIWTHVTGVYDGSDIHLYVNGAAAGPGHVLGIMQAPNGGALMIGGDPYLAPYGHPNGREFEGQIDEVQLFDHALSAPEIQSIYAAGSAGLCTTTDPAYAPSTFWLGLKNSDDQGTQFDLRSEASINNTLVSVTEARCITGLTRNPALAKEVSVPAGPSSAASAGDVLSVRLLTRIGTNADNTKCSGPGGSHNNATGLRLYFDSSTRPSRVTNQFTSGPFTEFFLHATGTPFLFLDSLAPTGGVAKTRDSGPVNFAGGNPWKTIGSWSMTLP